MVLSKYTYHKVELFSIPFSLPYYNLYTFSMHGVVLNDLKFKFMYFLSTNSFFNGVWGFLDIFFLSEESPNMISLKRELYVIIGRKMVFVTEWLSHPLWKYLRNTVSTKPDKVVNQVRGGVCYQRGLPPKLEKDQEPLGGWWRVVMVVVVVVLVVVGFVKRRPPPPTPRGVAKKLGTGLLGS